MTSAAAKTAILLFLVLYASIGLFARMNAEGAEDAYPFFSWFLFSHVPPRIQSDFEVRLVKAGPEEFSPSASLAEQNRLYAFPFSSYGEYYQLVQRLGTSVTSERSQETAQLRSRLEQGFRTGPVEYELVRTTFHPAERWSEGRVLEAEVIATFQFGEE